MPTATKSQNFQRLIEAVEKLREAAGKNAAAHRRELELIAPEFRSSAENLLHYLALRQRDLRTLQEELSHLGLSSLGRLEAHVDATLRAVLFALRRIGGIPDVEMDPVRGELDFEEGMTRLSENTDAILGAAEPIRETRIMVTMPDFAADSPDLIPDLVAEGMNLMRINCAHDSSEVWSRMVGRLRMAEEASGRRCRIAFDLAGPKLRTGPVAPEPPVFRWKPVRDHYGRTVEPARIRFVPADETSGEVADPNVAVPVNPEGFELLRLGRQLHLSDTRGRHRVLRVTEVGEEGAMVAECEYTGYIAPGVRIDVTEDSRNLGELEVADFKPAPNAIALEAGDRLTLLRGTEPGQAAERDARGEVRRPATIGCDFEPLFADCRRGEPILFDDGLISGKIREVHPDRIEIDIVQTAKHPARLRAEKGINLPDTRLNVSALTAKDVADLGSVVELADMVSLSFVRGPGDVIELIEELDRHGARGVGIVLKIETRSAFENLPAILLAALRHPPVAVMIARGDLGVEVGFERMAEVQEEILWICEAAHVPVIWATQVLESLAKSGLATRAEVTDAAMSSRAECAMLNKGPYIVQAVKTLSDILVRMQNHQAKKSAQMRPLSIAGERGVGSGTRKKARRKAKAP